MDAAAEAVAAAAGRMADRREGQGAAPGAEGAAAQAVAPGAGQREALGVRRGRVPGVGPGAGLGADQAPTHRSAGERVLRSAGLAPRRCPHFRLTTVLLSLVQCRRILLSPPHWPG